MHKILLCLVTLLLTSSCTNEPAADQQSLEKDVLQIQSISLHQTEGDCSTGDCLKISLSYPTPKNAATNLQKNMTTWTHDFLTALLDPALELDSETSLTSAIEGFIENYKARSIDSSKVNGHFALLVTDTILFQTEEYLTLRMNANSFVGDAPYSSTAAIATFDLKTGKRLRPTDLVNDLEKLYVAAENQFRETQKEAFADGFEFGESWPFVLAENVGLTTEGLFFCYVPYEVAPYVLGFTEFVIPYEQLEKL